MKLVDLSVRDFAVQLANPGGGPGGGSAAALLGLTGMALLQMASGRSPQIFCQQELELFVKELLEWMDEDQQAFAALAAAIAEEKGGLSCISRREQAVVYAIEVPCSVARVCLAGLTIAADAVTVVDTDMLSELTVAAEALQAAVAGSLMNMNVNLALLQNPLTAADYRHRMELYREQGKKRLSHIYQLTADKLGELRKC